MSFDETMSINEAVETRLSRYLETEALLNDFFSVFDYCLSRCIALEWILTGELPERQYLELVESIRGMIGRCRERQGRSASGDHILQSA
jgi:hypothetical protein